MSDYNNEIIESKFNCKICNKKYKSYQSYWNHNKINHEELNINICEKERNFECTNCNKKFTRKDTMVKHINNTCKNRNKNDISELKKQVAELQKIVLEKNNTNNSHNNNNSTINNGTINNNIVYINKTGTEDYLQLNEKEKADIFSKEISGIVALIKHINFNSRLPYNHSFCTKSLEGKYLLQYNIEESKIESARKKYFYQDLLSSAVIKMDLLYKSCKKNYPKDKQIRIEENIKRLMEIKERDFSDTILREIKNELIQLSYNCRDVVLKTWTRKTKGRVRDDNEQNFTKKQLQEFDDLFIEYNSSESDYESDSDNDTLSKSNKIEDTDSELSSIRQFLKEKK